MGPGPNAKTGSREAWTHREAKAMSHVGLGRNGRTADVSKGKPWVFRKMLKTREW